MNTKTSSLAFVCLTALPFLLGNVVAQDIQNSVVTVDELLKIDNAQALQKARDEAIKAGLVQPAASSSRKPEIPLPRWSVRSIFGYSGRLHADLVVDGIAAYSITPGATVAMCRVESIVDACVSMKAVDSKTRKGSCPVKVCWTGDEIAAEARPAQTTSAGLGGFKVQPTPLPASPIPIPSGSVSTTPMTSTPR